MPVTNGEAGDAGDDVGADFKDAAGPFATDGKFSRTRAGDGQIIRDEQFPIRQRDHTSDGQVDRVAAQLILQNWFAEHFDHHSK